MNNVDPGRDKEKIGPICRDPKMKAKEGWLSLIGYEDILSQKE